MSQTLASKTGVLKLLGLGALSVALYAALYLFHVPLLELAERGGWFFIVPVTIAFVFSYAHGAFTSVFWDVLGVHAKKS